MSENKLEKCFYTTGKEALSKHQLPDICHLNQGVPQRSIASDINLRPGYNRHDYDAKRPGDKLPTKHADIILACQAVYRKVGMVRNIIDLMTDFAAEGLELQHPIKTQERFYREWASRVDLAGRAHDFMKLLMRDANVIIRRKNAFITKPVVKEMTKGVNIHTVDETKVKDTPEKIKTRKKNINRREIPWKYTFLSPVFIEKIGGEVGRFFGANNIGMRIPSLLRNSIKSPKTDAEKLFIKNLPPEVVRVATEKGNELVALNMDRIYIDYYKKDDWEDWGIPFLYGVLEDVMFKEKMRLADMAALDGVINVIRLWKLGKSDQQIMPGPAIVDRLIGILQTNTGGGVMDLVWNDMIDLEVFYPPIDKILGADKYKSVDNDIVKGLGIPDSLIGGSDLGTRNAQSAFVQLKTLVERLEYIRGRAIRWMESELRLLADAMGFKKIPSINFGIMSLRDEAAEKQLIIQLLDRGIISSEKATEVFGVNFMIELERMKNEQKIREETPGVLEKSNPYNRPFSVMEKQTELAIELEKIKQGFSGNNGGGDNPSGDQPTNDGITSPGRPPSTTDVKKRDERTNPTLSVLQAIAEQFMTEIDNFADNAYLKLRCIKNIRSLSKDQKVELNKVKRNMLSTLRPGDTVNQELIFNKMKNDKSSANLMELIFEKSIKSFMDVTNKSPTLKDKRILTGFSWATLICSKGE